MMTPELRAKERARLRKELAEVEERIKNRKGCIAEATVAFTKGFLPWASVLGDIELWELSRARRVEIQSQLRRL